MLRLTNIAISWRIAIICLIPLLAFTGFAAKDLWEKRVAAQEADAASTVIDSAPVISGLVHELQRERGASTTFVSSKGQSLGDVMRDQRAATDKAYASWHQRMGEINRSTLGTKFNSNLEAAQSALGNHSNTRKAIDALTITGPKTVEFFTSTIANLTAMIDAIGEVTDNARIGRQSRAFTAFVQRKEFAGQERATGAVGFASEFQADVHRRFLRLGVMQDLYAAIFEANATPAQIEHMTSLLKGPFMDDLTRMRSVAANALDQRDAVRGVTAAQWFNTSTKYIDTLKLIEDKIAVEFLATTRAVSNEARWGFWSVVLIFAGLLIVTGGLAVAVAMSITRPISRLVPMMGELAKGNTDMEVPGTDRGDEIGTMANAVMVFRENLIRIAKMEAEQKEAELRAVAEREAATQKIASEFEAAVGGIVTAAVAGDFTQRVDLEGKTGLVLNIGTALNSLCENVAKALDDLIKMLNSLAEGNLTDRITAKYQGSFAILKDNANKTAERIGATIAEIKASAREITNASAEISTSTTDLSQRTEEQAASLEETSASMEEISATVKKNAENAQAANTSASGTRTVADRGGQVVAKAVEAMAKIEDSSRKISDIIGVIDEIARQTNLLALNAAVEAARAGEAGRGFAVVASEVRSLAQRSSQAAKDIKDLITNSNGQVKDGVELVNRAGTALTEIVESIKTVASIVADIANASAEQASGIEQVNKALTQMDEVTQQNSALVEENAATAKTLEHQAKAMDERVAFFKLDEGATTDPGWREPGNKGFRHVA
jgi:methyl-accepting chemotaxis protein